MSTGFLFGSDPMLAPDGDASRISTNIPSYEYPLSDYFAPVQTGILYEGAVATLEGGSSSYFVAEAQTPLYLLGGNYTPLDKSFDNACLENCSLGGCTDPTANLYAACYNAGCCDVNLRPFANAPLLNSQRVSASTDCFSPVDYCASNLDYYNCHPWSTFNAQTAPICVYTRSVMGQIETPGDNYLPASVVADGVVEDVPWA